MVGPALSSLLLSTFALLTALTAAVAVHRPTPALAEGQALTRGWNGLVYQGPALPPKQAFASLGDALGSVYYLGAINGVSTWLYYLPTYPEHSSLKEVLPMKAYWVEMKVAATYNPPAVPTPTPTRTPTPAASTTAAADGWRVVERGTATWYGPGFAGNRTACGDIFDPRLLTAASNTLPCGTMARVTNTNNGKSVIVKINDTGGFRPPLMIDLSQAAYETIAPPNSGNVPVTIEVR